MPFRLKTEALEAKFLQEAEQQGLLGLKGHRIVGGLRASMYIGMPMRGVEAPAEFMHDFAKRNG